MSRSDKLPLLVNKVEIVVLNLLQSWIFFLFSSGKLEEDVGQG
jgi:hypothetical protein